ncbi:MAG TPA: PP2C family protein-serine/threonine phosphatase [Bryobacteraceae bacterium]|nr:PP2C family protein-serine/threonine phosphatase [Bryobacteraceae bacterium]
MSSDSIPRDVVDAVVRTNLPFFGIACISLLAGVSALLLARLRSRDPLLIWVGVFSTLYAIRLFVENELVRDGFNAPGPGYIPWALGITYAINIPFVLFARELLGRGWKGSIVIWLRMVIVFALVAIPMAFVDPHANWPGQVNTALVVGQVLLVMLHIWMQRRRGNPMATALLWPLLIFCVFILLENKGFRPGGVNIEPVGFLILLAGLISTSIRRAWVTERRLIDVEQELSTARRIQKSIIPQAAPNVPCLDIATRYVPMSSVAGDFYDFLIGGDHLLTILVADVSGHGVPAALVASALKVCFAAQKQHANNPASVLSGINLMVRESLGGQYVTAACAAMDMKAGVITYAGAGHPPGFLLRKERCEIVQLAENGLFIGPFPFASYKNMTARFQAGDRLLLYTDGIVEASGPSGEEFGRERLAELFLSTANQSLSEFMNTLFQQISHGEQQDDLTAVVAQYR